MSTHTPASGLCFLALAHPHHTTWCHLHHNHSSVSDLRYYAEKYGAVKDVYLPKDYFTG
jgi:hypothetical protein